MIRHRHLGRVKAKAKNPNLGRAHQSNLEVLYQKAVADRDLTTEILSMAWPSHEGAFDDAKSKKLRIEALGIALSNGRPLKVIEEFRVLIEGDGTSGTLSDSSHLAKLIPLYGRAIDAALTKKKFYSVGIVFDGLSDKGNWVSVLMRGVLVGESMQLVQELLDIPHSSAPYNHAVLNKILIKAIAKLQDSNYEQDGPAHDLVRFFMHDDAGVNNLSCEYLTAGLFTLAMDFSCLEHVKYRVGENTSMSLLEKFRALWLALFKNADKRRHLFRELTGLPFPSFNAIKVSRISVCVFSISNPDIVALYLRHAQLLSSQSGPDLSILCLSSLANRAC